MSQSLWPYYERELRFIRRLAGDFAKQYPREAGRLGLEADRSTDPHVERLIEAFALLAARVQHKIDDDFPELTDALLGVLYPHYLAPLPSVAMVQFEPSPGAELQGGLKLPAHSPLKTPPVDGLECLYRTGYDVTLWPLAVADARLLSPPFPRTAPDAPPGAKALLRLRLDGLGSQPLADLTPESLRLYLAGDPTLSAALYELLFNHVARVAYRNPTAPVSAPAAVCDGGRWLAPVGFARDEALLPYPDQSFPGYRLLTEFFAYPFKFLFADLAGWADARAAGVLAGRSVEVHLFLDRAVTAGQEKAVTARTFRLGCTPVVNLFEKETTAFKLTQQRYDYPVIPDVHFPNGLEVYSVNEVLHVNPTTGQVTRYAPFYSFRHLDRDRGRAYWYARRRPSLRENDRGTEVDLHLVDLDFNPRLPAEDTALVRATCLNRDLPAQLQRAGEDLAFEPLFALPAKVRCLRAPTATRRPAPGRGAHWRLVSHLLLNHLSVAGEPGAAGTPEEGRQALQEYLGLYDFADPQAEPQAAAVGRQVVDGVLAVRGRRVVEFVTDAVTGGGYARGVEVTVELDEEKYLGVGAYLFASVLERFFALYASVNSFTKLVYRTRQAGEVKRWPPRAGEQPVV